MMEIAIWHAMPDPARERVCAWVRANDLDPARIPLDSRIRIEGDSITVEECVFNADGKVKLDPQNPNSVLRTTRTVPLLAPYPLEAA